MLHRMVLAARTTVETGSAALSGELGSLLACCLQTSVDDVLTGRLVVESGFLLEIIEGNSDDLCAFHRRAEADARIFDLQVLEFVPVLRRQFDTWAVARTPDGHVNHLLASAISEKRAGPFAVSQYVHRILMLGVIAETPPLCVAA
ncbi:BLUF domain-containing protein [Maricaulis sp.]|uniref:BLUF domain-containing protein n=1 Tax=Maricaulis sp. TaxID=1486257 RepID=UPI0025BAA7FB|nr:BLUF domain-containing protein [Maricaulis sp.]